MPNGYTAGVQDGTVTDLREFLERVGRGMSMAIMQRDSDPREPVKLREVSKYESERVEKAAAERERYERMTLVEAEREAKAELLEGVRAHNEAVKANKVERDRYDAMIAKVEAWRPDPVVQYVKDKALEWLRESREWDTQEKDVDVYPRLPHPADFAPSVWLESKRKHAKEEFDRAVKSYQEEVERVAGFNLHIEAFHRSLPDA